MNVHLDIFKKMFQKSNSKPEINILTLTNLKIKHDKYSVCGIQCVKNSVNNDINK